VIESIRLAGHVRDAMIAHARDEAPNECCGLLIGTSDLIDECVPARNIDPRPSARYEIDPSDHIAVHRRLRGSSRQLLGFYHSHPQSAVTPSASDCAEALYPELVWLIVSLAEPARPNVAAYHLLPDGPRVVTIIDVHEGNP
jgi:proteasome lid subunit RPN8/RPN11